MSLPADSPAFPALSARLRRLGAAVGAAVFALSGCSSAVPVHHAAMVETPHYAPRKQASFAQAFAPLQQNYGQCLADLGARAASFTPLPDQYYGAGCATTNAVRLVSLSSDNASLALANLGPVTCPLANTFAAWARYGVDRAARQILGSPLVKIETMGSYNCRNIAGSEKRSAHATGNAIDVSAFVLADGRRISLLGNWYAGNEKERSFLRVVHESACKRFGTVLGPEYNVAHRNHFHVELSNYAICH